MSVIGFTFGSFGDVLSILKIAYDVRALLSESKGASEEYQQLLAELDMSLRTLHLVQGVFLARDAASLPPDVQMAIQQSVSNSRTLILDLYAKIARFRDSLQKGGSGSMMRDSWRKIGWGLFKQDELVESRRRLSEQTNIIRSLLGLSNSITITRVDHQVRTSHAAILEISRCVQGIPQVLGYSWEGGLNPDSRPISLLDMLGQSIRLPLELCSTWEDLDEFLRFYFRKRAGRRLVERGDYDISARNGTLIRPVEWTVIPGSTINMNAHLRFRSPSEASEKEAICPSCNQKNYRSGATGITCTYCQTWFITSSAHIDEVAPVTPRPRAHGEEDPDSASEEVGLTSTSSETTSILDDIRFLRRIRVFADRTKPSNGEPGIVDENDDNPDVPSHTPIEDRTLSVGNLPRYPLPPNQSPDILENALRQLFQSRRGFRKLSFRQKDKGPQCLVEFAGISDADLALRESEGSTLDGLIEGGISLSSVGYMLRIRRLNPPPYPRELITEGDDIV